MKRIINDFFKHEAAGGVLLFIALIAAIIAENSPAKPYYDLLLNTPLEVRVGPLSIAKPLLIWINDALMSIFFFLVGLELKREILIGQLSRKGSLTLPCIAALLGIACPAFIYSYINQNDPVALNGWAIPAATDIAFALGVMSLLGKKVPSSLKLLLLSIAIIDDIGAILIIGIFYLSDLSLNMLLFSGVCLCALAILNKINTKSLTLYILVGIVLWVSVLKSGIHATLAGILLSMFIPLNKNENPEKSLLLRLEHDLHATVAFIILPIFAFANAGISFKGLSFSNLIQPIPLGISLGLIIGNQIGIFSAILITVKLGLSKLPEKVTWLQIYGLSALCGIGFTMSLFISSLAFDQNNLELSNNVRLGIIAGSVASALIGYTVLRFSIKKNN